jgi:hypothetical protein
MKFWHLVLALLVATSFGLLASCGDSADDDEFPNTIAFTPLPTATPVPKLCGNGVIDAGFEECEEDTDCNTSAGESCVCCLCLAEGEELGVKEFTIARPPSRFISTGLAGGDVSTGLYLPGPLLLSAGRPDPNLPGEEACSASLQLLQSMPDGTLIDGAIFGFSVVDGSTVCVMLFSTVTADEPASIIDCDGGTAHDTEFMQNSNGPGLEDPPVITTGLGDPIIAGPGAAALVLERMVTFNLPFDPANPNRTAADVCFDLDYDNPFDPAQMARYNLDDGDIVVIPMAFTTKTSTAIVTNPLLPGGLTGTTPIMLSATGANFSCAGWSEPEGPGTLVGALAGLDTIVGDTVNAFVLTDRPQ